MRRNVVAISAAAWLVALAGCPSARESAVHTAPVAGEPLYRAMTDADVRLANAALDGALERNASGVASDWDNAASGNRGSVTPLRTFRRADGTYCRDYREVITIGADSETYSDTACRAGPRLWRPLR